MGVVCACKLNARLQVKENYQKKTKKILNKELKKPYIDCGDWVPLNGCNVASLNWLKNFERCQ